MSDANRTHTPSRVRQTINRTQGVWLLGLLIGMVVLLCLGGESLRVALRYERLAVLDEGEYWRLLTGHFVHGSTRHALLNIAGLAVLAALFPSAYRLSEWLAILVGSLIAIDVGFVWNQPQLIWYVGLSGVLHGVLAAGAIAWWRYESSLLALLLTLIVVGKLTWEQTQGALPFSGDMPVIVAAHLYGAVAGAGAGVLIWCMQGRWLSRSR